MTASTEQEQLQSELTLKQKAAVVSLGAAMIVGGGLAGELTARHQTHDKTPIQRHGNHNANTPRSGIGTAVMHTEHGNFKVNHPNHGMNSAGAPEMPNGQTVAIDPLNWDKSR